ncbi:MAG: hypothetical protein QNJ55_34455 [Xenococcus sp. MO_188.B8]|nr:hypothetical protein [Xenococcus sp. MO_188.B8]
MELPNLGKPGSILSILVPGTFLLFNIIVGFYFLLWNETVSPGDINTFLKESRSSLQVIVFLVLICVAYLVGAILRLMKCDVLDNISGWYLKNIECLRIKEFPYIDWIGLKCGYEYQEAKKFYELLWENNNSNEKKRKGKSFLNFYKVVLISVDENLANECYAAEAFTRYLSSIFYGLFFSFVIILLVLIKQYFFLNETLSLTLLGIDGFYTVFMFFILRNYRYIRMKEVETLFAATFAAKEKILKLLGKELS